MIVYPNEWASQGLPLWLTTDASYVHLLLKRPVVCGPCPWLRSVHCDAVIGLSWQN